MGYQCIMVFSKYTKQGSCSLFGCQLCLVTIMSISYKMLWKARDKVKSITDLA